MALAYALCVAQAFLTPTRCYKAPASRRALFAFLPQAFSISRQFRRSSRLRQSAHSLQCPLLVAASLLSGQYQPSSDRGVNHERPNQATQRTLLALRFNTYGS
jgi:hypothetical protein